MLVKFLEKDFTLWNKKRTVIYAITSKGIKAFGKNYRYEITNSNCKSDSICHDLGLIGVRERLEKANMVTDYYSENMLKKCSFLVNHEIFREFSIVNSDAALSIETPRSKFNVAIEYEISIKDEFRYIDKLNQYYFFPKVALVLYICGDHKIEKLIRKADEKVYTKYQTKVCTCLEETFYKSEKTLPFTDRNNEIFEII